MRLNGKRILRRSTKLFARTASLLLLVSFACSVFTSAPPPKAYIALPLGTRRNSVQIAACSDFFQHDILVPVLVTVSNTSQSAWTLDADQISATVPETPYRKWLPIPAEQAARMSPVSALDGIAATLDRAGIFATYGAGLGAAGGAFYSHEQDQDVSNGFQLGAGYGALIGLGVGAVFEALRLTYAYETNEAGDANEKMKFLALKDRSILYTDYSTIGYVYFSRNIRDSDKMPTLTIPLIRGDPSKDWVTPPPYEFPRECEDLVKKRDVRCMLHTPGYEHACNELVRECALHLKTHPSARNPIPPERYEDADLSPLVCNCTVVLAPCDRSARQNVWCSTTDEREDRVVGPSCNEIGNGMWLPSAAEPETRWLWPKLKY